MKKFTKKLLAVLMAVIMVCTVLPLHALAADTLAGAISEFEAVITGMGNADADTAYAALRTNLAPAYTAYLAAIEARDSEDTSDDAAALADLNTALGNMQTVTTPTANGEVKIGEGTNQPVAGTDYQNVIYARQDSNDDILDYTAIHTISISNAVIGFSTYGVKVYIYYPEMVLLDDGVNTPKIPVTVGFAGSNKTLLIEDFVLDTPGFELYKDWSGVGENYEGTRLSNDDYSSTIEWQTKDIVGLRYSTAEAKTDANTFYNDSSVTSKLMMQRNSANYVRSNDNLLNDYSSTIWNIDATGGDYRRNTALLSDKNSIFVINYGQFATQLKNELHEKRNYFTDMDEFVRSGELLPVLQAIDTATAINVNGYDYSAGAEAAARDCASDMEDAISAIDLAVPNGSAAQVIELEKQIAAYELKMQSVKDGEIFTNMAPAYVAYIKARQYRDAYVYGKDESLDLAEQAQALKVAVNNMKDVGSSANYISPKGFINDSEGLDNKSQAYKDTYKNLAWAGMSPYAAGGLFGDSSKLVAGTGQIAISEDYTPSYLLLPRAVGVCETATDEITVPIMFGFSCKNSWGIGTASNSQLYNYWLTDSDNALSLKGHWQMATSGDSNQMSLDGILGVEHQNAVAGDSSTTGIYRSHDKTSTVQPQNYWYYANTLKINQPSWTTRANTYLNNTSEDDDYLAYYYKIDTVTVHHKSGKNNSTSYSKEISGTLDGSESYQDSKLDDVFGTAVSKAGSAMLDLINYEPVNTVLDENRKFINNNADFNIADYVEGGLYDYLAGLDNLTGCDPRNRDKYKYEIDAPGWEEGAYKYSSSRTVDYYWNPNYGDSYLYPSDKYAQDCAKDIAATMKANQLPSSVDDSETGWQDDYMADNNIHKDTNVHEDPTTETNERIYDKLIQELEKPELPQTECINPTIYERYATALTAARKAVANVAVMNAQNVPNTNGYVTEYTYSADYKPVVLDDNNNIAIYTTEDGNTQTTDDEGNITYKKQGFVHYGSDAVSEIEGYTTELKEAREAVESALYQTHRLLYNKDIVTTNEDGASIRHGLFDCHVNNLHDTHGINEADMEAYYALNLAYNTLDHTKYTNFSTIQKGRNEFLKVKTEPGAAGETAQEIVDDGVFQLLESINKANEDETDTEAEETSESKTYTVTYKLMSDDGVQLGTTQTVTMNYGVVFYVDFSTELGSLKAHRWELTTGVGTAKEHTVTVDNVVDPNSLPIYVQEDVTVTAYYTPAAGENTYIEISNVFDKKLFGFNVPASTSVTLDNSGEFSIGDATYLNPSTMAYKVTGWQKKDGTAIAAGTYTIAQLKELFGKEQIVLKPTVQKSISQITVNPDGSFSSNDTYTVTLDGEVVGEENGWKYDDIVQVKSTVDNIYAIAIYENGKYVPVAYKANSDDTFAEYSFYANRNMNFYSMTRDSKGNYAVNGETITEEDVRFYLNYMMPMCYASQEFNNDAHTYSTTRGAFTTHLGGSSLYGAVNVTEWGMLYGINVTDESQLVVDNVGRTDLGTLRVAVGSKNLGMLLSNQFYLTLNTTKKTADQTYYTRGYVKYQYVYQGTTIDAIAYSNLCINEMSHGA